MDAMTTTTTTPQPFLAPADPRTTDPVQLAKVRRVLRTRSFATLATTSPRSWPHVAGVLYDAVDTELWVHTTRSSRKARNVADNPHVAVCVPFRKLPAGPPYTLQFQATAELVAMDDPRIVELLHAGRLPTVSGHGALDMPDGVFLRVVPNGVVHSYGLGENPVRLVRDPLNSGARSVHLGGPDPS